MDRVGIYDARARLSELIERVERGEEVTITRNRKPVAKLVPARRSEREEREKVFEQIDSLRKEFNVRKRFNLRELIEWGRK